MTKHEKPLVDSARCEFHVSREIRDACQLSDTLFSVTGNVIFADFRAAREFAHRLNQQRDIENNPELAVSASRIYALGLIDEVLHLVVARHREQQAPGLWNQVLGLLSRDLSEEAVDRLLGVFVDEFPPRNVYRGELSGAEYLNGESDGVPNRETAMEELVMLWLANRNPAFAGFRELFDDRVLRQETDYETALEHVETFLGGSETGVRAGETLLDRLYAPMRAAPTSIEGQLEFIRRVWVELLGPDLHRVLGSLDFLTEEQRVYFPPGPGPAQEPPDYRVLAEEGENYSLDREWMPRLVLLAKNAHVWLSQLSRKYGRDIRTLDEIPDEELTVLAEWGMTGLWLIGVWERSRASERIKKKMGDEDAVASAYSLEDYRIANALGGEDAYEDLKARAWRRGIRISTDMVPNHMGIDSRWVIEHSHWFLSLDHSPYPSYNFNGPDLCDDERVGIFIEDHYWERSDAAVVFKRVDRASGDERFIYHGNDGTSMPWNDTAQLDYLQAEVREAVIQTILAVARRSPVIRFDAAMTLARQHYHRLWFPEPGAAGAVPSRAEYGMTRAEFDAAMPREFWREVVDRVAEEAPDTLLLAEAFWLLEGYFVRTLGMHRVYNSAFMNMLRDERNAEYRQLIRSTLEFDPQILKRYVNFMSNPDERTAVDQFDTGDKYFGVATLMATLPGLPMFGHGQIEGLAEKYGMEFQRPRWQEEPNEGLVWRHELQLFPLLRRRRIFSEVDEFLLYDYVNDDQTVDENVFAYSNVVDGERSLVVYNNRFGETDGRIRLSTAVAKRSGDGDERLVRTTLRDGLHLSSADGGWVIVRDAVSGLEHLYSCRDLGSEGFRVRLDAYRLHVFLDFRDVTEDESHPYSRLASQLGGRGVRNVDEALGQLVMAPILEPVRRLLANNLMVDLTAQETFAAAAAELRTLASSEIETYLARAAEFADEGHETSTVEQAILNDVEALLGLVTHVRRVDSISGPGEGGRPGSPPSAPAEVGGWSTALMWILVRHLGGLSAKQQAEPKPTKIFEEWHLNSALVDLLMGSGQAEAESRRAADAVGLLLACDAGFGVPAGRDAEIAGLLEEVFATDAGERFLGIHPFEDSVWFDREAFEELAGWLALKTSVDAVAKADGDPGARVLEIGGDYERMVETAANSGYRVGAFLEAIRADYRGGR